MGDVLAGGSFEVEARQPQQAAVITYLDDMWGGGPLLLLQSCGGGGRTERGVRHQQCPLLL